MAGNLVDLAKLIKAQPVTFPKGTPISSELKDALTRMLTPDYKKRINWEDLFNHPVNKKIME